MIAFVDIAVTWLWVAFLALWFLAGLVSKRTVQVQSGGSRLLQSAFVFLGVALMFNFHHWITSGWLAVRLTPANAPVVLCGGALTLAGLLFCVWARVVLGRNWSSAVTIKQDHQLVLRGPYRIVRHPIYTGLLIALLGTAMIIGVTRAFVGVLVIGLGFWLKSQTEEQFMLHQFGAQYVDYRQRVHALIPFVL